MVVVKIGDGMGNQLFNYACGYAAARRGQEKLMLDTSECDNSTLRDFELDKLGLMYDARESFPNRNVWQKIYKRLRRNLKYHVIKERVTYKNRGGRYPVEDVDPAVFEKRRFRDKYLHGYWQNLAYFEEYLHEILAMIKPAYEQDETVKRLIKEFQTTPTCAIHVRGGDITGPGRAYFERAVSQIEQEHEGIRYIIFTNDQKKAKEALGDHAGNVSERMCYIAKMGKFSDVDEFFLMAACQNQILSNSTYSTWAAYVNPSPQKTVIMPEDAYSRRMKQEAWIIL